MAARKYGALFLMLSSAATPLMAQQRADIAKEDVRKIVREILLEDPELLQESLNRLARHQKQKADFAFEKKAEEHRDFLERDNGSYVGEERSEDIIVVFTDFNCKFCKQMAEYLKENPQNKYKIVMKDLPILGENSERLAKISIAMAKFGSYEKFYFSVYSMPHANKSDIRQIIRAAGLDPDRIEREAEEPWVTDMLARNRQVASELGINATPMLIHRGKKLKGGFRELHQMIPKPGTAK